MINVSYETKYDGENEPRICKIVSVDGEPEGSEVVTNLTLSNKDELVNVSAEEIWEHMQNMVDYMKVKSSELTLVNPGLYPDEGWPNIGWAGLNSLNEELTQWWLYVSRRDVVESSPQVLHYH